MTISQEQIDEFGRFEQESANKLHKEYDEIEAKKEAEFTAAIERNKKRIREYTEKHPGVYEAWCKHVGLDDDD